MSRSARPLVALVPALLIASRLVAGEASPQLDYFEKHVRPLLAERCYNCHSANTNSRGGLRVDDRNGLLKGGERGAAIVPGDVEASLLIQAVRYQDEQLRMPPEHPLPPEEVAILEKWIADGAVWPQVEVPRDASNVVQYYDELRAEHWAWQPLRESKPPDVSQSGWPRTDVDRFVLAKLESEGLAPVGDSDRTTLARRLAYDLTGLPPSPDEVAQFTASEAPDAVEQLVDRLLASSAFGERWGRHWLDVARYGESTGSSRNLPYPHAWRYRDYVIAAFNKDKPFDQFIREQLAGDLLSTESAVPREERIVATGFLALGVKDVNQRFKVRFTMDNIDEQIDAVSRSFLALTVSCARCHDHKFDPIPTTDYYSLAGIFHSTDLCAGLRNKMGGGGLDYYDVTLLLPLGEQRAAPPDLLEKLNQAKAEVAEARKRFQALKTHPVGRFQLPDGRPLRAAARQTLNKKQAALQALNDPALLGPVAYGVRDAVTVGDTELRVRGEAEQLGPLVPRGYLNLFKIEGAPPINATQSGRLELANWIAHPQNPLTSRVIVNRVWQHLFGEGLVRSVDNFGVNGDTPTHPELLDYLAAQFVREGWSIKRLIRSLVLTRTYQLAAMTTPEHLERDPANRLLWRHAPRRQDAEELRDTMLALAGALNPIPPDGSPAQSLPVVELRNNGPEARKLTDQAANDRHRSVYLPLLRGITPWSLAVFDFAEQGMVTGRRDTTTVATQALYLMNDPFVIRQAQALSARVREMVSDDRARIDALFRLTLGRSASATEVDQALTYVAEAAGLTDDQTLLASGSIEPNVAAAEAPTSTKPAQQPANPDEADQTDAPIVEEVVALGDPQSAAWTTLVQALFASAEFRYIR